MSHVLSYYGKPVACGDLAPLKAHGEDLQKTRSNPYGLAWSDGREGAKLMLVQPDDDGKAYRSWGGYMLTEVPAFTSESEETIHV